MTTSTLLLCIFILYGVVCCTVLDKACKDTKNKHFQESFKIELFLEKLDNSAEFKVTAIDGDDGLESSDDEDDA